LGKWGFPGPGVKPDIKALIAIVPDPARTNMALQFDRTIDALMGAASDNGYLSTYYWLPWKGQSTATKEVDVRKNTAERQHEPGLVILKYPLPAGTKDSSSKYFTRVIYLFLVGETPTTGVDGFQIQKAFRYEDELARANIQFARSTGNRPDTLSIIGPTFTGSAASIRQAIDIMLAKHSDIKSPLYIRSVSVSGATATEFAAIQLRDENASQQVRYSSFAYDASFDEQRLLDLFCNSSSTFNPSRVAILVEDGTTFGNADKLLNGKAKPPDSKANPDRGCSAGKNIPSGTLYIRFPREISLLRNAQAETTEGRKGGESSETAGAPPSPYLRFSLKDSNTYDSVPHLSRENTPLSQEAQLMAIARQLLRNRTEYIVISGSNALDLVFLSQFLHRACPDARLVFYVGDLLFEREVDNVPFIGSLTLTPYPLFSGVPTPGSHWRRAYPDSNSQAYFNAASFTFWDSASKYDEREDKSYPELAGYLSPSKADLPLWVTAIANDGYYPLGIASDRPQANLEAGIIPERPLAQDSTSKYPVAPGRAWKFLCVLVIVLCLFHSVSLWSADFWSPFTRELAVSQGDQPRRRAMYVNIATAMLFCMALVLAIPRFAMLGIVQPDRVSDSLCSITIIFGTFTAVAALWRIRKHVGWIRPSGPTSVPGLFHHQHIHFFFNAIAWATMLWVPGLWVYLCSSSSGGLLSPYTYFVGPSFSYRCVYAWSGVSPVLPVLLLLFSWYSWSFFSTLRLRFSHNNRPMLPGRLNLGTTYPLFVADDDLGACRDARDACLYRNITCLLITREVIARFLNLSQSGARRKQLFDAVIILGYLVILVLSVVFIPVRSLDAFLWKTGGLPSPYEFLVTALFFPLLFIALSTWLRLILVWGALRRGLLERLENLPIRFAFSRLKGAGWMTMLRQGGMHEQWRDMARCSESIRQMVNDLSLGQYMATNASVSRPTTQAARRLACWSKLNTAQVNPSTPTPPANPLNLVNARLNLFIDALLQYRGGSTPAPDLLAAARCLSNPADLPALGSDIGLVLMRAVEENYAEFSEVLLERALVPYWRDIPSRLVDTDPDPGSAPLYIRVAEEFLAIRYVSLIRVVLVNIRSLLLFVSASFVLAIVAWNSYPFQPRQFIDLVFTCMLMVLGGGVIWVLAQMHRDSILSRITDTKPNELGWEFYARIITLGAVPVLTWVAYQFPGFGSALLKFLQPGLEVVK
jgi:hypothetical protein